MILYKSSIDFETKTNKLFKSLNTNQGQFYFQCTEQMPIDQKHTNL